MAVSDPHRLPEPTASVVRIKSGRVWVDVLMHDDGRLFLAGYNLGPDADDDEAREFADELRQGFKGMMAGLDDAGPWVDQFGQPLPGQGIAQLTCQGCGAEFYESEPHTHVTPTVQRCASCCAAGR